MIQFLDNKMTVQQQRLMHEASSAVSAVLWDQKLRDGFNAKAYYIMVVCPDDSSLVNENKLLQIFAGDAEKMVAYLERAKASIERAIAVATELPTIVKENLIYQGKEVT